MDTQTLAPPIDVIEDFQALLSSAFDDPCGDKVRRLVGYFDESELKSQQMQLHSDDFEQKELARMLRDAFAAAKRILLVAAETANSNALAD